MPKKPGATVTASSLANLELGRRPGYGRTPKYGERKKPRGITVTDSGWDGLQHLAQEEGVSVSELIERIGRGLLKSDYMSRHQAQNVAQTTALAAKQ